METKTPGIIFMGTPEFAVASLEAILDAGYEVRAVVTAPDKAAGRGRKIRTSPVKEFALDRGLNILQPTRLKDPGFVEQIRALEPDLQVVVAFRMLPELIWRVPSLGTFNLHASLLPAYRGAAPINHAIMNGECQTGVTTFLIDEQIDTGNILLRKELTIGERENAGELHDRLMISGARLVVETIRRLLEGSLEPRSQDQFLRDGLAFPPAPKIHKEDCRIDWDLPGREVANKIRGLSPYPGAFTHLEKREGGTLLIKVFEAEWEPEAHGQKPGSMLMLENRELKVAVDDGWINIHALQQEGKRRMDTVDFLLGFNPATFQPRFS